MKKVLFLIITICFVQNLFCQDNIEYLLKQANIYFQQGDFVNALKYIEDAKSITEAKINEKYYSGEVTEIKNLKEFNILWKKYIGKIVLINGKFFSASENSISFQDTTAGESLPTMFMVKYSEKFTDTVLKLEKDSIYKLKLVVINEPIIHLQLLEINKFY